MNSNITLNEIATKLNDANSVLIFTHVNPDGDAIGSSAALCGALRKAGKEAWVITDEEIPEYVGFIGNEGFTQNQDIIAEPDICVCLDCSEESRIPGRVECYKSGKTTICLDHHFSGENVKEFDFAKLYYVDSSEAATAQIVFKLLREMKTDMSGSIAEAIYTGIITDTGCFQYSNTEPETHRIAAELMAAGIDHMKVMVALYQNTSLKKVRLQNKILDTLELFCDGKASMVYVTGSMIDEVGASMDDAEGAIDTARNIEGVEIAAFLKEKDDCVKVSMRAKTYGRVDEIAAKFNGGGHMKAAGCTIHSDIEEAGRLIKEEIEKYLEN